MRYDLTPEQKARLTARLNAIPEIRADEVAQMVAYASHVVRGGVSCVEPPHPYESRYHIPERK